jgi:DNA-binding MarR family transcriptional regulator
MHCLGALFCERPLSLKRLYDLINVSPSRASKILKHLEERGLVCRTMDSSDRRRGQVALTDLGATTVDDIMSHFSEVGGEFLGAWRRERGADFSWLLGTVAHTK